MNFGNLSTWNSGFGDTTYTHDNPFGAGVSTEGIDYRGNPTSIAAYSFQEGYAGPYGNVFQRIFSPRKWEQSRGLSEGDASLFKPGSAARQDYFSQRREKRKADRQKRQGKRQAKRAASEYRVVRGAGGYVYKERGDGTIEIIKSPKGGAGRVLSPGDQGYSAIKRQIQKEHGAFRASGGQAASATDWLRIGQAGAGAAVDILSVLRKDTPPPAFAPGGDIAPASRMPPWLLPVGIGLVGVVILASVLKR